MPSDDHQERLSFSELLADVTDSDVVIEIAASQSARQMLESGPARRLRDAVEASYRALAGGIDVKLERVAVLDELTKDSLSIWLRVHRAGDGAIAHSADASLLKFLARGMLALIAWMDGSPTLQLADLQQALRVLAWGTSITTAAQPALPTSSGLVDAISAWQKAKASLELTAKVRIVTTNGSATIDLSKIIEEPRALLLSRKLVNHSAEMIFLVEMPDYDGSGKWELKHGGVRTIADCQPGTLLEGFYRRELDIRPGDALRCKVDVETSYGPDHEVLAKRYRIVDILEVLPAAKPEPAPTASHEVSDPLAQPAHELEPAAS
jgi:flagellar hook-basal body complex protein FliE